MVIVLMWILVCVVFVCVIVTMRREDFFYDIDEEKSCHEGIYSERSTLKGFRKYMHE